MPIRTLDALEAAEADRAALEASLGRATAVLRQLLGQYTDACGDVGRTICITHGFYLPCPVGAARALLGEREGT